MKTSILKHISFALLAILSGFGTMAMAEDEVTLLTVNLKDGTKEQFNVPDKPTVKVENHQMAITSGEMSGSYNFADVSHFSFEKGKMVTAIEDILDTDNAFTFSYTDNRYVYIAAPKLQSVAVYTVSGQCLMNVKAAGSATLDLESLTPGVYVVKPSCHEAVKVVKH